MEVKYKLTSIYVMIYLFYSTNRALSTIQTI